MTAHSPGRLRGGSKDAPGNLHLVGRRAVVVIVSTTAAREPAKDLSGPVLHEWLTGMGLTVDPVVIVPDGPEVEATLRGLVRDSPHGQRPRFIVTSGGTGLNSDDVTPESTERILERQSPGIMHALWSQGLAKTPTAVMSRGVAGHVGTTFVVNLPGSRGGVKDGTVVLGPLLDHISAQLEDIHGHGEDRVESMATASSSGVVHAEVTPDQLDPACAREAVTAAEFGAVVSFSGVIRDHDGGRTGVTSLEYSSHPDAQAVMRAVAEEIAAEHPRVRLWVAHRIGALAVGDSALEAAVASAHRKEAFAACDALVDRVKERVPIWKRQTYTDGTHSWVGLEG